MLRLIRGLYLHRVDKMPRAQRPLLVLTHLDSDPVHDNNDIYR